MGTKTAPKVKQLLYPSTSVDNVKAIQYEKEDPMVKKQLECILREEQPYEEMDSSTILQLQPCGIFIDFQHYGLAATPDALLLKRGIVEIKCPYSIVSEKGQMRPVPLSCEQSLNANKEIKSIFDSKLYFTVNYCHEIYKSFV